MNLNAECPVCGNEWEMASETVEGELLDCTDCGSELEVKRLCPLSLEEAPQEEEDWGE